MINKIKSLIKNEDGQTLVLVALLFSVLLGFAALSIDYGYLSLQKRKLQNAADAAALAGIVEVSENKNPTNIIYKYVNLNIPELSESNVSHKIENDNKNLTVNIEWEHNNFFANVLGIKSSTVSASATATWDGGNLITEARVLPLAILNTDYENFKSKPANQTYGHLGFIGNEYSGFYDIGMQSDDRGYFGFVEDGKIEEYDAKDIFAGEKKGPLIKTGQKLYSIPRSYKDPLEGIDDRLEEAFETNKNKRKDKMTAIIPVVSLVCEESSPGICKKSGGKDVLMRTNKNLKVSNGGNHYQFRVEYFVTVYIRDVIQNNGIYFWGLDELLDSNFENKIKYGWSMTQTNNPVVQWRNTLYSELNTIIPPKYYNLYSKYGIVVSFGDSFSDAGSGNKSYKLIK